MAKPIPISLLSERGTRGRPMTDQVNGAQLPSSLAQRYA